MTQYVMIMTSWLTDIILYVSDNNSWYYLKLMIGDIAWHSSLISITLLHKIRNLRFKNIHKYHLNQLKYLL